MMQTHALGLETPFDGDANPEFGPPCPKCGAEMDWMDCELCGTEGYIESDADDYTDRTVVEKCMACMGDGGVWYCELCGSQYTEAYLREPQELNQREE